MLALLAVFFVLVPLGVRLWTAWRLAEAKNALQQRVGEVERLKKEVNQIGEGARSADQELYLCARERSRLYEQLAHARAELKALKEGPKDKRAGLARLAGASTALPPSATDC